MLSLLLFVPSTDIVTALKVGGFLLLWVIASASGIEKLWGWITGSSRQRKEEIDKQFAELRDALAKFQDKDVLEKRFVAIEEKATKTGAEVTNQHNTLLEMLRERERLASEFRTDIGQLKKETHELSPVPGRVSNLETKLDNLTSQISEVKAGQREMKQEMREDMRGNKAEILQAIESLKKHSTTP